MQSYFEICGLKIFFVCFARLCFVLGSFFCGFWFGFFVLLFVCLLALFLIIYSIWCNNIKWIIVKIYLITQGWSLKSAFFCSFNNPQHSVLLFSAASSCTLFLGSPTFGPGLFWSLHCVGQLKTELSLIFSRGWISTAAPEVLFHPPEGGWL